MFIIISISSVNICCYRGTDIILTMCYNETRIVLYEHNLCTHDTSCLGLLSVHLRKRVVLTIANI